jgi:predicted transcriptional regulator
MGALSLRLPDDLEARLEAEAGREGVARSEVARMAIQEFLDRKERERFVAAFVAEARAAYADPAIRKEALAIAGEALPLDNEALDLAERAYRVQAGARRTSRAGRKR